MSHLCGSSILTLPQPLSCPLRMDSEPVPFHISQALLHCLFLSHFLTSVFPKLAIHLALCAPRNRVHGFFQLSTFPSFQPFVFLAPKEAPPPPLPGDTSPGNYSCGSSLPQVSRLYFPHSRFFLCGAAAASLYLRSCSAGLSHFSLLSHFPPHPARDISSCCSLHTKFIICSHYIPLTAAGL